MAWSLDTPKSALHTSVFKQRHQQDNVERH
jgi:hypothetical protein